MFYNKLQDFAKDKDDNTVVLAFDYMQNLPLPEIPVQEIFYLRQLWLYVFCIYNVKTKKAVFYCYHEGQGNKSPDEVCSCLLDYFINEIPSTTKNIVLFSDGPSGQNKNNTMVRFLLNLVDNKKFETISHYFPVRGHSFMPCDRSFGCVKRLIRRSDRVYIPEQYMSLIEKASNAGKFLVKQINTDTILSFKTWWLGKYKKVCYSDETSKPGVKVKDRSSFKVSSYRHFEYNSQNPGKVTVRKYIDSFASETFTFSISGSTVPSLPTAKAYPAGRVPINSNKIKDLTKLAPYLVGYENFYDEIYGWPSSENQPGIDNVSDEEN